MGAHKNWLSGTRVRRRCFQGDRNDPTVLYVARAVAGLDTAVPCDLNRSTSKSGTRNTSYSTEDMVYHAGNTCATR